ncbi:hypothetical protein V6Z12_A10G085800 [Gossypium hirsutum]
MTLISGLWLILAQTFSLFMAFLATRYMLFKPKCVQKERIEPEDMYVLSGDGAIISSLSPKPYRHKPPKCSDCASLFMKAYRMRNAGAVIHSHEMESCLATMINPHLKEFRISYC